MQRLRTRKLLGAVLAASLALAVLAAGAIAAITMYKNNFSNGGESREVKLVGGGECRVRYARQAEALEVTVTRGSGEECTLKTPVIGDMAEPNHRFRAKATLKKSTSSAARDGVYYSVEVRNGDGDPQCHSGGNDRYELRVFPRDQRGELRRTPTVVPFPDEFGPDEAAIERGMGDENALSIDADGDQVEGTVNGTLVEGPLTDPAPGDLAGCRVTLRVGHTADTNKNAVVTFDNLKLQVPDLP